MKIQDKWMIFINVSFLSNTMKRDYKNIITDKFNRLFQL